MQSKGANDKIFTQEENKYQLNIPKEERDLNTTSYDYSVQFLVSLMEKGKIVLEVPFQRKFIWDPVRKSQLIESIIMNVPIPPLYFAEEKDGRWLVIDGLQRLNTILNYYKNEFILKKLEIIRELEKKRYADLPPKAMDLLNDGLLRVNVIKFNSHPDIKYDIFMRLNKGAVILNYQELRNCLYRGELNDMVKKFVSENIDFLELLKLKKPHDRFLDVEFILRHLALAENLRYEDGKYILKNYTGRLVNYINEFMKAKKDISKSEAEKYATKFKNSIKKVITVFGKDKAFRDISISSTKVSKPLADIILLSFAKISHEGLKSKATEIIALLNRLLTENEEFRKTISQRTSDKDVMHSRINIWFEELKKIVKF